MLQNFLDEEDNNFITALTAQDRDVQAQVSAAKHYNFVLSITCVMHAYTAKRNINPKPHKFDYI